MDIKGTKKTTDKLQSELKKASSIEEFVHKNKEELKTVTVPEFLNEMLIKYNLEKKDVIRRSDYPGNYAYKIFCGEKNGSRERLLWLAFGFPLSLEETKRLLRAGGYNELSAKNKRDALVIFALDGGYTINEVNKLLIENEEDAFA